MSMRCRMVKETLQNSFAVGRDVEEATECDMCCVDKMIRFLQNCTDEVAIALERRVVHFREAVLQLSMRQLFCCGVCGAPMTPLPRK